MPNNFSQSKDAKKWPTDANFQTPTSTGRNVEMASANTAKNYVQSHNLSHGSCHKTKLMSFKSVSQSVETYNFCPKKVHACRNVEPHNLDFQGPCRRWLLKMWLEKEKTSISSFPTLFTTLSRTDLLIVNTFNWI